MSPHLRPVFGRALIAIALVAGLHVATATAAPEPAHGLLTADDAPSTPIPAPISWTGLQEAISSRTAWFEWAAALPAPAPPAATVVVHHPARPRPSGGSHRGYGSARECVSMVENGGSYDRGSNPSHVQRYQFSRSAWISFGGNPATWGTASPEEQDAVFDNAWSQGPAVQEGQWLEWDGCGPPD